MLGLAPHLLDDLPLFTSTTAAASSDRDNGHAATATPPPAACGQASSAGALEASGMGGAWSGAAAATSSGGSGGPAAGAGSSGRAAAGAGGVASPPRGEVAGPQPGEGVNNGSGAMTPLVGGGGKEEAEAQQPGECEVAGGEGSEGEGEGAGARLDAWVRRRLADEPPCPVCLEPLAWSVGALPQPEGARLLRVLPLCQHCFHAECLDPWLLRSASCPICRRVRFSGSQGRSGAAAQSPGAAPQSAPRASFCRPTLDRRRARLALIVAPVRRRRCRRGWSSCCCSGSARHRRRALRRRRSRQGEGRRRRAQRRRGPLPATICRGPLRVGRTPPAEVALTLLPCWGWRRRGRLRRERAGDWRRRLRCSRRAAGTLRFASQPSRPAWLGTWLGVWRCIRRKCKERGEAGPAGRGDVRRAVTTCVRRLGCENGAAGAHGGKKCPAKGVQKGAGEGRATSYRCSAATSPSTARAQRRHQRQSAQRARPAVQRCASRTKAQYQPLAQSLQKPCSPAATSAEPPCPRPHITPGVAWPGHCPPSPNIVLLPTPRISRRSTPPPHTPRVSKAPRRCPCPAHQVVRGVAAALPTAASHLQSGTLLSTPGVHPRAQRPSGRRPPPPHISRAARCCPRPASIHQHAAGAPPLAPNTISRAARCCPRPASMRRCLPSRCARR